MTTSSFPWTWLGRVEPWAALVVTAGFLMLYGLLRGAPPGISASSDDELEEPSTWRRERVVAGVAMGLLLILTGGWLTVSRGVLWSLPAFALGFGLVLTLIKINDRYRHVSPSLRRTAAISRAVLNLTLAAGILVVANVAAFRYGGKVIDVTRERTYSLSSLTMNQLAARDSSIVFHLVHGRSELAVRQMDRVAELLELYRSARPDLVRIERLDRHAEMGRADELARRAPDPSVMQTGGVLIEMGTGDDARYASVGNPEMFENLPDFRGAASGRYESTFRGEDAVTSALIRLSEERRARIGFVTGHGESGSERLQAGGMSLDQWKSRLASIGCDAVSVNLLDGPAPENLRALVVAGPRAAFKPQEAARLQKYADEGNPVLLCLSGDAPGGGSTGLEEFLKSFNLELGAGVVVDPQRNLDGRSRFVFCPLEPSLRHPATEGLRGDRAILLVDGSPIRILGSGDAPGGTAEISNSRFVPFPVLRSGRESFVDPAVSESAPTTTGSGAPQDKGPLIVAAAVSERAMKDAQQLKPRLFLISSRAAADDAVVRIEPANLDLMMNAVSWLRGREESVGVPAQTHQALTLTADPSLRWRLILAPTVVSLAVIAALGGLVYAVRRE